jgi:transcriptional regulator with XRE-family HTH domain
MGQVTPRPRRVLAPVSSGGGSRTNGLIEGTGDEGRTSSVRFGAYLRRLREGYGYTLRKVEERAQAMGESLDNSQLSRFEKGKAFPSFDKLRALARIFNVSVQSFSDVLDLEEYESFRPAERDYDALLREGASLFAKGEHGRAFVTYERAFEIAEEEGTEEARAVERMSEARWRMAACLKALGKLGMTEHELREILKLRHKLGAFTRLRTLLQLSQVYRELGDFYLATVLSRECLELAAQEGDLLTQASLLNGLGNIQQDEGDLERGVEHYRRSLSILDRLPGNDDMRATVLTNLGGCLCEMRRFDEGTSLIRQALSIARERGFRRSGARALTRLAEAHLLRGEKDPAAQLLAESDAIASHPEQSYYDILFLNAYRRWEIARREGHGTREKISFGRLRHLRSLLERRFPEVDAFDRYVERTRRQHEHAS